jgi:hypothetical protein
MSSPDNTVLYQITPYVDHIGKVVLDGTLAQVVAQDKGILEIGLGKNLSLGSVTTDLTFVAAGHYTSVITWDASAHSQIANDGTVTQGGSNVTADVVATITKYTESDTKTFSVTVLAL